MAARNSGAGAGDVGVEGGDIHGSTGYWRVPARRGTRARRWSQRRSRSLRRSVRLSRRAGAWTTSPTSRWWTVPSGVGDDQPAVVVDTGRPTVEHRRRRAARRGRRRRAWPDRARYRSATVDGERVERDQDRAAARRATPMPSPRRRRAVGRPADVEPDADDDRAGRRRSLGQDAGQLAPVEQQVVRPLQRHVARPADRRHEPRRRRRARRAASAAAGTSGTSRNSSDTSRLAPGGASQRPVEAAAAGGLVVGDEHRAVAGGAVLERRRADRRSCCRSRRRGERSSPCGHGSSCQMLPRCGSSPLHCHPCSRRS